LLIGNLVQNGPNPLSVFEEYENPVGVPLVRSTFGYCVKYTGVVSENYPWLLLDFYFVDQPIGNWELCPAAFYLGGQSAKVPECQKFAEIFPINEVNQ
jgi:hypothetical protein